jgi:hypothetical protein
MAADQQGSTEDLLARGGGNATAAGVSFQASLGAVFGAQLLAERSIEERLQLGGAQVRSIRFETEAPLDDILIGTDADGWVFVQAKTTLSLSNRDRRANAEWLKLTSAERRHVQEAQISVRCATHQYCHHS